MKIAQWWYSKNGYIMCDLCPRFCKLTEGQKGFCRARQVKDGKLVSLVYNQPCSLAIDPIEKKPLYHFKPGSSILSIGTAGCNFACSFCQNHTLVYKNADITSQIITPDEIVSICCDKKCPAIAFTYNEPTVNAEYVLDCARLSEEAGLDTVMVTNGYINEKPRKEIYKYISAANVDLKAYTQKFYQKYALAELAPVLVTIEDLLSLGVWVELTTLIIPGINDREEDLVDEFSYLRKTFGSEIVLHLSAFHPSFKMMDKPRTPEKTMEQAYKLAHAEGLSYVYLGNVATSYGGKTVCSNCKKELITRNWNLEIAENLSQTGKCFCGNKIPGVFEV
jgi:pyruvate formate lyase activating enzyme